MTIKSFVLTGENGGPTYGDSRLNAGTADFCFEMWIKGGYFYAETAGYFTAGILGVSRNGSPAAHGIGFEYQKNVGIRATIQNGDTQTSYAINAGNWSEFSVYGGGFYKGTSDWHHYAITRVGTTVKLYVDGVLKGSTTIPANMNFDTNRMKFGEAFLYRGCYVRQVQIADVRYTVGTPVYTSNFAKPSSQLTDIVGSTKILWSFANNSFVNDAASGIDAAPSGNMPGWLSVNDTNYDPALVRAFLTDQPYTGGGGGGGGGSLRKPLFLGTDGKPSEMAGADSIQLGALTLSGAIAMGSNKITGIAQATSNGDVLSWGKNASIANLTVTGSLGANLDAGGYKISSLVDPISAQDASTKAYVDAVKAGLDYKVSVRCIAVGSITLSGLQTVDGVSVVAGNRVLVAGNGAASGIYVAASGAWSRATDADSSTKLNANAFCFVEEGTTYADTGWVMTANQPFTLGTTSQAWVQFSSKGVVLAGIALAKAGNTLYVLYGDGLTVNGSNQLAVNLATDPGLQFTSTKLDLKLASSDRLAKDASGLDVTGVPAQFKIDGASVSANVTSANLATLTAGIESDATALHVHKRAEAAFSGSMAVGTPVYFSANNTVVAADSSDDAKRWVSGVVRASSGGTVKVVSKGVLPGVLSSATAGTRYYLASGGGITATQPGVGENSIVVGFAANATDLVVRIIDQGKRAV